MEFSAPGKSNKTKIMDVERCPDPTNRSFIIDSGASVSFIAEGDLTAEEWAGRRKLKVPHVLNSANGTVEGHYTVQIYVQDLDDYFIFLVLKKTPAVLAMGSLTRKYLWRFLWDGLKVPTLTKEGKIVQCWPWQNVPFVTAGKAFVFASPAELGEDDHLFGDFEHEDEETVSGVPPGNLIDKDFANLLDDLVPDVPAAPPPPPVHVVSREKKSKTKKSKKFKCPPEDVRRDQKALLYKHIPAGIDEINVYFYDEADHLLTQRLGLERQEGKVFSYRTLSRLNDPTWPKIRRIVTYCAKGDRAGERIRDVRIVEPGEHANPNNPLVPLSHYMTHFPKDPNCPICMQYKVQKKQNRKKKKGEHHSESWVRPKTFAEQGTMDHADIGGKDNRNASMDDERMALIILDLCTLWLGGHPTKSKSGLDSLEAAERYYGPGVVPQLVYTDGAPELEWCMKQMGAKHDTCTPHVPQSNGLAEGAVRKVKEGTSCVLAQSGLALGFWSYAMLAFCFNRNITDVLSHGFTAYQLRFGEFKGLRVPFGALIDYMSIKDGKAVKDHPLGPKTRPGIFMGYAQHHGGRWAGDYMVLDAETLASADKIQGLKPLRIRDIVVPPVITFPVAAGKIKQPDESATEPLGIEDTGNDEEPEEAPPNMVESSDDDEPSGAPPGDLEHDSDADSEPDDSKPKERKPGADYWHVSGEYLVRVHVVPRFELYTPERCPFPVKWLDVHRRTETNLPDKGESRIDDYWYDDAKCRPPLSTPWTGRTMFSFTYPIPKKGHQYVSGQLVKNHYSEKPEEIWPTTWQAMTKKAKKAAKDAWAINKPLRDSARSMRSLNVHVPEAEAKEYWEAREQVKKKYKADPPPACPLTRVATPNTDREQMLQATMKWSAHRHPCTNCKTHSSHLANHGMHGMAPHLFPYKEADSDSEYEFIVMPDGHREKIPGRYGQALPFVADSVIKNPVDHFGLVHLSLQPHEWKKIPEACKKVQAEYDQLKGIGTFDMVNVMEFHMVAKRASDTGKTIYFGRIFPLCQIKHSELPPEFHVYKGRVVFGGNNIRDENGLQAVFAEQGTSASHMICAKFLDAVSRIEGYDGNDSDAQKAYTQAKLTDFEGNTETWIDLPEDQWPDEWKKKGYKRPIVRLIRNLYGHPLAGLYWEKHCHEIITKCGWEAVQGWECLFKHKQYRAFLSVYVDDFKVAAPKNVMPRIWADLGAKDMLRLDPPTPLHHGIYLGCCQYEHYVKETEVLRHMDYWNQSFGDDEFQYKTADQTELTEERAIVQAARVKKRASKSPARRTKVSAVPSGGPTGHLKAESGVPSGSLEAMAASTSNEGKTVTDVQGWHYSMHGHVEKCVEKYLELTGLKESDLKLAWTPCIDDHQLTEEDYVTRGKVADTCARIVLKILFFARIARPDVLCACNQLAREVSKWTVACDRRLYRLVCYLQTTKAWVIRNMIGDTIDKLHLAVYSDASFAGEKNSSKSTTGGVLCLVGPRSFVSLNWICKKQGAVSHSSTEAEIVGLDTMVRMEGIPALNLWSQIVDTVQGVVNLGTPAKDASQAAYARYDVISMEYVDYVPPSLPSFLHNTKLVFMQDNDAVIKMVVKCRAPTLKHVPRTHRINLDWLFERCRMDPCVFGRYIHTKQQIADMLTKGNFTAEQWEYLCVLLRLGPVPERKPPPPKPKE